jgi:hypothetical protein
VQLLDEPKGGLGLDVGALTERKHRDERDASIDSRVTQRRLLKTQLGPSVFYLWTGQNGLGAGQGRAWGGRLRWGMEGGGRGGAVYGRN